MKIAYLDCFSGISGDMFIAAFLDAGLDIKYLNSQLDKLKIGRYTLAKRRLKRSQIACTKFTCIPHKHYDGHRALRDIVAIIEKSSLSPRTKSLSKEIFTIIGEAEKRVHGGKNDEEVWLHELGSIDSLVDIIGAAIAVEKLDIDEFYASCVNMGRSFVRASHGVLPVPAPAVLEILKDVPIKMLNIDAELVTPTGAGILKALVKRFDFLPVMNVSRIGYGAGSRELDAIPNMLRVFIGEAVKDISRDKIMVIDVNIDDMNPQYFDYIFEKLAAEGAVDYYVTPVHMKKNRPAFKLTVLCDAKKSSRIISIIFDQTTAIGVRFYEADRAKLQRKVVNVKTEYGMVSVKVSGDDRRVFNVTPEYDDCARLADSRGVGLKFIQDAAKKAFYENI